MAWTFALSADRNPTHQSSSSKSFSVIEVEAPSFGIVLAFYTEVVLGWVVAVYLSPDKILCQGEDLVMSPCWEAEHQTLESFLPISFINILH